MILNKTQKILLINASISCEPSNFLFSQIVRFLELNQYYFFSQNLELKRRSFPRGRYDRFDAVLINTCCVTQKVIDEADQLIDYAAQDLGIKKIILFGCYAKIPNRYVKNKNIISMGPKELSKFNIYFKHRIPIEKTADLNKGKQVFVPYQKKITQSDCFVLISQGCYHQCSYCNIRLAKGSVLSRGMSDICQEIKARYRTGEYEFVLLSDDCGSYGRDRGVDLVDLMEKILSMDLRIKLKISSIFPGDMISLYPRFKKLIATRMISYLNLPIQSGSDRILKLMNRNYSRKEILRLVKDIRRLSPDTWLYSHFIINFPTETKADFIKSLELASFFDEVRLIPYSCNPLTAAAHLRPEVDKVVQAQRIKIAMDFVRSVKCGTVAK